MKTKEEMKEKLVEVESDERLSYELANIQINTPLALVQLDLKAKASTLRWVLGLPMLRYHGRDTDGS